MNVLYSSLILLLMVAIPSHAEEPMLLKTYTVSNTDIEETASIIPLMMPSTNGLVITTIDRKLVVRGTAEQHQVVVEMLRELDAPPKNIQINVQFNRKGQTSHSEIGWKQKGPIIIGDGDIQGSMEGRFSQRSRSVSENTTQMLVAMDGRRASLRVGETVPQVTWLMEYGYHWGYVQQVDIEWRDVGSFLTVEPTIVSPGVIRIKLTPELSGRLENGDRQRIQFTHLTTEVLVGDGQSISIGGFSKDKEFSSKFFIGRNQGRDVSVTGITLTPHILK